MGRAFNLSAHGDGWILSQVRARAAARGVTLKVHHARVRRRSELMPSANPFCCYAPAVDPQIPRLVNDGTWNGRRIIRPVYPVICFLLWLWPAPHHRHRPAMTTAALLELVHCLSTVRVQLSSLSRSF